jgi:hypothetical protein
MPWLGPGCHIVRRPGGGGSPIPPSGGDAVGIGCRAAARPARRPHVDITLVKRLADADDDRAYRTVDGQTRRGPIHVVHDLPHLVESPFDSATGCGHETEARCGVQIHMGGGQPVVLPHLSTATA